MRCIQAGGKEVGSKVSAQVIAPSRGHVTCTENLFILDVFTGKRKYLSTKTQLAYNSGRRILLQLAVSRINKRRIPLDENRLPNGAIGHNHFRDRSIGKLKGKGTVGAGRYELNLTRR